MPGSFIDQRERSNEELKSKGRIERERQWASKVKGSSVFQNISKGMSSLWKRCVNLFYSQVVRDKLSPGAEPRHFSLQSSRGARSSRQAILYDYNNKAMKNKSRKQFPTCSQNWLPPHNIREKAMAPHCSTLAWKIPWTEEPGRLQSMGSLRVRHD